MGALSAQRSPLRLRLLVLATLFIASGFAGLIQEQVYEKLLGTLLGTSTPAAAIVLATYFAGITIGAWLYSRFLRARIARRLRFYGILEAGAGLWAISLFLLFDRIIPLFVPLLQAAFGASPLALIVARLSVAVLWILPPTLLIGATLPAVADGLADLRLPNTGRLVALFYSLNLLGAILGAGLGPYLLFAELGLDRTLALAGIVGCAVGLASWRLDLPRRARAAASEIVLRGTSNVMLSPRARLLLLTSFLGGLGFFALEVIWVQLISVTFGNSIYSFATMLVTVLLGLFIGGQIVARRLPQQRAVSPVAPGVLLLVATVPLALGHDLWPEVPGLLAALGGGLESFAAGEALKWTFAIFLIVPASALLGAVFPILFRIETDTENERQLLVGFLAAVNSIGSVLGALLATFVLIPVFGSEASHLLIGSIYALLGLALILVSRPAKKRRLQALVVALACLAFTSTRGNWNPLSLTSGENVYFRKHQVNATTELLFFHEDSRGGITTVVEGQARGQERVRTLLTNGKFQGNNAWEASAQVGFALIPILHTEKRDRALVIGFGTGHSSEVVRSFGFDEITLAEIAPGILEAAEYFEDLNNNALERDSTRLELEDGRNLLLLDETRYDLITMEISSVWFAGATNLYSREFYQLASERLEPGGIFQQWLQLHHLDTYEILVSLATARSVFEHVSFWVFGGQGIVVASQEPQALQARSVRQSIEAEEFLAFLGPTSTDRLRAMLGSRLLAPQDVTRLVSEGAAAAGRPIVLNTDRNRRFEYSTPRWYLSRLPHRRINVSRLAGFSSFPVFDIRSDAGGIPGEVTSLLESWSESDYLEVLGITRRER